MIRMEDAIVIFENEVAFTPSTPSEYLNHDMDIGNNIWKKVEALKSIAEMRIFMVIVIIILLQSFVNYIVITTIADSILMGILHFHFSTKCSLNKFLITKENRIDFQDGNQCAAFSAAYVLRHWNIEESGNNLYQIMPGKLKDGCVYPKGIQKLLFRYGFKVKYCAGNIKALKNEVSKGNPVIVMMRTKVNQNWLHFVPVVGYDEHHIFIAESLKELVNSEELHYNRKIPTEEFIKFWNTSMLKMPFYRNTYFVVIGQER